LEALYRKAQRDFHNRAKAFSGNSVLARKEKYDNVNIL
jgi:hypothetical protein